MLLSSTFAGLAFFFRILYFIASTVIGVDVSEVGQAILALSRWVSIFAALATPLIVIVSSLILCQQDCIRSFDQ